MRKIRSHLWRIQSSNLVPFKSGIGQYIAMHATLMARDFFCANFYRSVHSPALFPKPVLIFVCCWLWLTPVPVRAYMELLTQQAFYFSPHFLARDNKMPIMTISIVSDWGCLQIRESQLIAMAVCRLWKMEEEKVIRCFFQAVQPGYLSFVFAECFWPSFGVGCVCLNPLVFRGPISWLIVTINLFLSCFLFVKVLNKSDLTTADYDGCSQERGAASVNRQMPGG